ncbi:hypothetical protein LBMAG57_14890 [Verrucomicrobiota bacterium]|nr:hypothetical protein LBMAG57_14890 [Verrucomicrobiota bacterium]
MYVGVEDLNLWALPGHEGQRHGARNDNSANADEKEVASLHGAFLPAVGTGGKRIFACDEYLSATGHDSGWTDRILSLALAHGKTGGQVAEDSFQEK